MKDEIEQEKLDSRSFAESNDQVRAILYFIYFMIETPNFAEPGLVWRGIQHECEFGDDAIMAMESIDASILYKDPENVVYSDVYEHSESDEEGLEF